MQLNGEDMTYDAPNYAWTKVITTTADNTPVSIVAKGAEYSKATGTEDAAAVEKTLNYTLADGKMTDAATAGSVNIAKAGTYTITVKLVSTASWNTPSYRAIRQLLSQRLAILSACSARMLTPFLP